MTPPQSSTNNTQTDGSATRDCDSDSDIDREDEQQATGAPPKGRVVLSQRILRESSILLQARIRALFRKHYNQEPKDLQVDVVERLVRGHDVFFHAGTGFGKTRIAEMYFWLHGKRQKPLYLVLNPLDALGDNQVTEKLVAGISAFNCTSETFTDKVVDEIKNGDYTVLYVSPEIFLHEEKFKKMYFSQWFRDHLVLKVVDEAHMIYTWGIVESGKKYQAWVKCVQDSGIFRPSYGRMGMRLAATDRVPLLLMSATCPPRHRDLIYANLKIRREDIDYVEGELARPEITILRLPMQKARSSFQDLAVNFPLQSEVPDSQLPPTLIYSNTRKSTKKVLKVLNQARGVLKGECNPKSTFARRFHSNTGPTDKTANIADYAASRYPIIACTLALGLGQNWTRVRRVFQFGRADAAAVSQIIGRCGRNGKPGQAVFYVEKHRNKGKNSVLDFNGLKEFSDDDLMDGLAVTPVCLRIAMTLSNLIGRIPMSKDEDIYVAEKERQEKAGMRACQCSNCEPEVCKTLASQMKWLTNANFDTGLQNPDVLPYVENSRVPVNASSIDDGQDTLEDQNSDLDAPTHSQNLKRPPPRRVELTQLAELLNLTIKEHHKNLMNNADRLRSTDYIDDNNIWRILQYINTIQTDKDVFNILGCDILPGGVAKIFECINNWRVGTVGMQALTKMRAREAATRFIQAKTFARLKKQHEERQAKEREARVLNEIKRKQSQINSVADKEAKRQRKEQTQQKKIAAANLQADKESKRASNARMIASLRSGKSMAEVEADEDRIRAEAGKENLSVNPSNNQST